MKRYHDRMNETWLYDRVNKLNNISQHKFRFLKYFDTFLSKKKKFKVVKEKFYRISPP